MNTDNKTEVIKRLKNRTEEQIDEEFDNLIYNLTESQFWKYIKYWKSVDDLIEYMRDWDTDTKEEAIDEIKKMFKIK